MTSPAPIELNPTESVSQSRELMAILSQVASGGRSVDEAAAQLKQWAAATSTAHQSLAIDGATIDLGRRERCGFGEVIFGEGKSTDLMIRIVESQLAAGQDCFITRLDSTAAAQVRRSFAGATYNPLSRTMRIVSKQNESPSPDAVTAHVAVVTAGSTDAAVAEEAIETLGWMKIPCHRFCDVGVAGPQRLLGIVGPLRTAAAIVVVAGMEGALPSALAGHVAVPVIAVPTSSGYGANLNGLTPLMGMLSSCSANVAVVNIDAGFKGGYVAGLIAKAASPKHAIAS